MNYITVIPAYGRDYKKAKEVKEAWLACQDFLLAHIGHRYDGKPCCETDFADPNTAVIIRYKDMTKLVFATWTTGKWRFK